MKGSMHHRSHSGRRHRAKYCAAFTLIEVLFGIALLGFLAIAFSAAFPLASRMQAAARYRAQATRIARRELEAVRSLKYNDLATYTTLKNGGVIDNTNVQPAPLMPQNTPTSPKPYSFGYLDQSGDDGLTTIEQSLPKGTGVLLTGVLLIEEVTTANPTIASGTATNLRRITVTVSWTDPSDRSPRSVVLQSLVAYLEKKK